MRKSFEVALHAGAAAALLIGQRRTIAEELRDFDLRRAAGPRPLLPARGRVVGYTLERPIEQRLGGPRATALGLLAGAGGDARRRPRPAAARPRRGDRGRRARARPRPGGGAGARRLAQRRDARGGALAALLPRPGEPALAHGRAADHRRRRPLLKGVRLRRRGASPELRRSLALGVAASFASTLASQRLIRLVERDRALWPYAAYRARWPRRRWFLPRLRRTLSDERRLRDGPGSTRAAADAAVAAWCGALAAIELGRARRAQVPLPGPLRERAPDRRADRDRALHRRRRHQAARRRAARPLRHGRHRLRRDERQRRDLRRRRADRDARLHRGRARRPRGLRADRRRPARAAPSWPGSRSPAASWPSSATSSRGFDLAGACFGTVALDAIVDGAAVEPGDAVIGLPSSGLHSNGYTLARSALEGIPLDEDPEGRLGRPLGDVLLEPTEIYVKPVLELLRSDGRRARPRPHHLGRPRQPAAPRRRGRLRDRRPAARPAGLRADPASAAASPTRRCTRSSTWAAASAASSPRDDEAAALELLRAPLPRGRSGSAGDRRRGGSAPRRARMPQRDAHSRRQDRQYLRSASTRRSAAR